MNAWYLELSSFRGWTPGAIHWYGTLRNRKKQVVRLTHRLSAVQAARLNRKDEAMYVTGDESERFESRAAVLRVAKKEFHRVAAKQDVLLLGSSVVADPLRPIAGPAKTVAALCRIWQAAQRSGGWDRNEKAMQRAADRWDAWWQQHTEA